MQAMVVIATHAHDARNPVMRLREHNQGGAIRPALRAAGEYSIYPKLRSPSDSLSAYDSDMQSGISKKRSFAEAVSPAHKSLTGCLQ